VFILFQGSFSIYCDDAGGKENQPAKPAQGKVASTLGVRPAPVPGVRPAPVLGVRPAPDLEVRAAPVLAVRAAPALPRLPTLDKENTLPTHMPKVP